MAISMDIIDAMRYVSATEEINKMSSNLLATWPKRGTAIVVPAKPVATALIIYVQY